MDDKKWIAIPAGSTYLEDLPDATEIYFRLAETVDKFASESVKIIVPAATVTQ